MWRVDFAFVTEWDGTQSFVEVFSDGENVGMRYPDGESHLVGREYFLSILRTFLNPTPLGIPYWGWR